MTLEDLVAIEEIKALKARYLRFMDQRRWDDWMNLLATDATIRVMQSDQQYCFWEGKDAIRAGNSARNTGNRSVHHGHTPDIEILDAVSAKGTWMLFDRYLTDAGAHDQHGYYEDEYVKADGRWRIKAVTCCLYPG